MNEAVPFEAQAACAARAGGLVVEHAVNDVPFEAQAACAASCGKNRDISVLETILERGIEAAHEGQFLPIPLLLDAFSIAHFIHPQAPVCERGWGAPLPKLLLYDEWLHALRERLWKGGLCNGGNWAKDTFRPEQSPCSDWLDVVVEEWRNFANNGHDPAQWKKTLEQLQHSVDFKQTLLGAWSGERVQEPLAWEWLDVATPTQPPPNDANSAFRTYLSGIVRKEHKRAWVHENMGYGQIAFYLQTEDLEMTQEQRNRLRRLMIRPKTDTSEYKALPEGIAARGHFSLFTLTLGDYGFFKIANDSDLKLNSPEIGSPPKPARFSLRWLSSFEAVTQQWGLLDDRCAITRDAFLKGMLAVVLDDWRAALRAVPIRFRLCPRDTSNGPLDMGRGGKRWKSTVPEEGDGPAPDIVRTLFTRCTCVEAATRPCSWQCAPPSRHYGMASDPCEKSRGWCCGFMLLSDMPRFHFSPKEGAASPNECVWIGLGHATSESVSKLDHIVLIDDRSDQAPEFNGDMRHDGTIYAVGQRSACVELHPVISAYSPKNTTLSRNRQALRSACLDLAIAAAEFTFSG